MSCRALALLLLAEGIVSAGPGTHSTAALEAIDNRAATPQRAFRGIHLLAHPSALPLAIHLKLSSAGKIRHHQEQLESGHLGHLPPPVWADAVVSRHLCGRLTTGSDGDIRRIVIQGRFGRPPFDSPRTQPEVLTFLRASLPHCEADNNGLVGNIERKALAYLHEVYQRAGIPYGEVRGRLRGLLNAHELTFLLGRYGLGHPLGAETSPDDLGLAMDDISEFNLMRIKESVADKIALLAHATHLAPPQFKTRLHGAAGLTEFIRAVVAMPRDQYSAAVGRALTDTEENVPAWAMLGRWVKAGEEPLELLSRFDSRRDVRVFERLAKQLSSKQAAASFFTSRLNVAMTSPAPPLTIEAFRARGIGKDKRNRYVDQVTTNLGRVASFYLPKRVSFAPDPKAFVQSFRQRMSWVDMMAAISFLSPDEIELALHAAPPRKPRPYTVRINKRRRQRIEANLADVDQSSERALSPKRRARKKSKGKGRRRPDRPLYTPVYKDRPAEPLEESRARYELVELQRATNPEAILKAELAQQELLTPADERSLFAELWQRESLLSEGVAAVLMAIDPEKPRHQRWQDRRERKGRIWGPVRSDVVDAVLAVNGNPSRLDVQGLSGKKRVLTAAQESEIRRRLAQPEVIDAMRLIPKHLPRSDLLHDEAVNSNGRMILRVARSYTGWGVAHVDLLREGGFILNRAAYDFNPEFGVRFGTYFYKALLREFRAMVRREQRLQRNFLSGVGGAAEERHETFDPAAAAVDLRPSDPTDQRDPRAVVAMDVAGELWKTVLLPLTAAESFVVTERYLKAIDKPVTYQALGASLGMTKEGARKVELRAIPKLKAAVDADPKLKEELEDRFRARLRLDYPLW